MISELAQIFMRVASLVSAQEELSARIEDDMSSALQNLHEGKLDCVL
jgi:t-SNARE complex subunit (syntaxin)